MININHRRGIRQAGCILLIAMCVRHCPTAVRNAMRLFIPNTLINVVMICSLLGIRQLWRRNMTLTSLTFRIARRFVSLLRTILLQFNMDVDHWPGLFGFTSLTKMMKEIVLYYSLGSCFSDTGVDFNYAWLFCLLCNSIIGDFVFLFVVEESHPTYRIIHTTVCFLAAVFFMLLRLGPLYVVWTNVYYFMLQDWFVNSFILKLKSYDLDWFEGLEKFYIRISTYLVQFLIGAYCIVCLYMQANFIPNFMISLAPAILTAYVVCYPAFLGFSKFIKILHSYHIQLRYFSRASKNEIKELQDVCAICLAAMETARRTPCRHYFHGKCLVRSLRHKLSCPICKIPFDIS